MLEKYFKSLSEKVALPFIKLCIFLKIKPNTLSVHWFNSDNYWFLLFFNFK